MTQLILDTDGENVALPESVKGGYKAALTSLTVEATMISGRLVKEVRGDVWEVSYQYGFFDTEMKNKVLRACRRGLSAPLHCGFLPPESEGLLSYSDFFVTSFREPRFRWSRVGEDGLPVPMWADFSVTLREVRPSD